MLSAAPRRHRIHAVDLRDSLGRILARDQRADRDIPPFDRAALDGYAIHAECRLDDPAGIPIAGEIAAGSRPPRRLPAGVCVRIWTGAPAPPGVAGIVPVERAREEGGRVHLDADLPLADARRPGIADRGEDARRGDLLLEAGRRIGPGEAAVLASIGRSSVPVYPEAATAILMTGREIVPPVRRPTPVQIRSVNDAALGLLLRAAFSVEPRALGIVDDDPIPLRRAIRRGLRGDVLVITGGVSAGGLDLVPAVLEEIGVEISVRKAAIRPGKPFLFGTVRMDRRRVAVFGLPGNPVSALVTGLVFLLPYLRAFRGEPRPGPPRISVRLEAAVRRGGGMLHFVPCRFVGEDRVAEIPMNGSGDIVSASRADAFLMVPGDGAERPAGTAMAAIPIPGREPVVEGR